MVRLAEIGSTSLYQRSNQLLPQRFLISQSLEPLGFSFEILKDGIEEHLFRGALVDNSPGRAVPQQVNDYLEEELLRFLQRIKTSLSSVHSLEKSIQGSQSV